MKSILRTQQLKIIHLWWKIISFDGTGRLARVARDLRKLG